MRRIIKDRRSAHVSATFTDDGRTFDVVGYINEEDEEIESIDATDLDPVPTDDIFYARCRRALRKEAEDSFTQSNKP